MPRLRGKHDGAGNESAGRGDAERIGGDRLGQRVACPAHVANTAAHVMTLFGLPCARGKHDGAGNESAGRGNAERIGGDRLGQRVVCPAHVANTAAHVMTLFGVPCARGKHDGAGNESAGRGDAERIGGDRLGQRAVA